MDDLKKCLMTEYAMDVLKIPTISNDIDRMIVQAKSDNIDKQINDTLKLIDKSYYEKLEWVIGLALRNKRYGNVFVNYVEKHLPINIVKIVEYIYELEKQKVHYTIALNSNVQYNDHLFNELLNKPNSDESFASDLTKDDINDFDKLLSQFNDLAI